MELSKPLDPFQFSALGRTENAPFWPIYNAILKCGKRILIFIGCLKLSVTCGKFQCFLEDFSGFSKLSAFRAFCSFQWRLEAFRGYKEQK